MELTESLSRASTSQEMEEAPPLTGLADDEFDFGAIGDNNSNALDRFEEAYSLGYDTISDATEHISARGRRQLIGSLIRALLDGANASERHQGWRPRRLRLSQATPATRSRFPAGWNTPTLAFPLENRHSLATIRPLTRVQPTDLEELYA